MVHPVNSFILPLRTYELDVEIHSHSAYQIVISSGNSFFSIIDGSSNPSILGFTIKPNVAHKCTANCNILNIINVEPYSTAGLYLKSRMKDTESNVVFRYKNEIEQFFQLQENAEEVNIQPIITSITQHTSSNILTDNRVEKVITHIDKYYADQNLSAKDFTELTFLSYSRLASIFKQQTGSSISKYILWTRLRKAIYLSLSRNELSLTDIAFQTGFYDLPQLNKYMYQMIGVSPRALKQNSNIIQVIEQEDAYFYVQFKP